jgi:hypothetical protein
MVGYIRAGTSWFYLFKVLESYAKVLNLANS